MLTRYKKNKKIKNSANNFVHKLKTGDLNFFTKKKVLPGVEIGIVLHSTLKPQIVI